MARLHVGAAVRWPAPRRTTALPRPTVLWGHCDAARALRDGRRRAMIEQLNQGEIRAGYQYQPEPSENNLAVISDFDHNGPSAGGTGWYSCILRPQPGD